MTSGCRTRSAFRWNVSIIALAVIFGLCAGSALAQAVFGNITGNITDPAGAVVPNAKVSIRDVARGAEYTSGCERRRRLHPDALAAGPVRGSRDGGGLRGIRANGRGAGGCERPRRCAIDGRAERGAGQRLGGSLGPQDGPHRRQQHLNVGGAEQAADSGSERDHAAHGTAGRAGFPRATSDRPAPRTSSAISKSR